jgi:hypothetical protein
LAQNTRCFDRPVNTFEMGPSGSGKNFVLGHVSDMLPPEDKYFISGGSPKSLIYDPRPIKHKVVIIAEASGMNTSNVEDNSFEYFLRTFMSEGEIRYQTVEKDPDTGQLVTVEKVREGPIVLCLTSTRDAHDENATRMLALYPDDSTAQTRRILDAIGRKAAGMAPEPKPLEPWHAYGRWLAAGPREVVVPYAEALAALIPETAVRLRRDMNALISLIRAHAWMHQHHRARDAHGRILATLADYEAVRPLIAEAFGLSTTATVTSPIRRAVLAVRERLYAKARQELAGMKSPPPDTPEHIKAGFQAMARRAQETGEEAWVHGKAVGLRIQLPARVAQRELGLDKSTANRALRAAVEEGFLAHPPDSTPRARVATEYMLGPVPLPSEGDHASPLPSGDAIAVRLAATKGFSDTANGKGVFSSVRG